MNRGVINAHATLGHHLLDVAQALRVGNVPAHAHQHHLDRIVHPLDDLAQRVGHRHQRFALIDSAYHRLAIATEPLHEPQSDKAQPDRLG